MIRFPRRPALGAVALACLALLAVPAPTPARAGNASACLAPDSVAAADQRDLDQGEFAGFKSVVVARLEGAAARNAAAMLIAFGAPDSFAAADTILILNALPPRGRAPMANRHIVAFKSGCAIGAGFAPAAVAERLIGDPA